MATCSSILARKMPWEEKPGRLQSIGLQRVGHDRAQHNKHSAYGSSNRPHHMCPQIIQQTVRTLGCSGTHAPLSQGHLYYYVSLASAKWPRFKGNVPTGMAKHLVPLNKRAESRIEGCHVAGRAGSLTCSLGHVLVFFAFFILFLN